MFGKPSLNDVYFLLNINTLRLIVSLTLTSMVEALWDVAIQTTAIEEYFTVA